MQIPGVGSTPPPTQLLPVAVTRPAAVAHPATAASTSAQETLATTYSTTVAGESYSASVAEADGEYEASVAGLPGVSATGSSIQSAETNLGTIIDTLA